MVGRCVWLRVAFLVRRLMLLLRWKCMMLFWAQVYTISVRAVTLTGVLFPRRRSVAGMGLMGLMGMDASYGNEFD